VEAKLGDAIEWVEDPFDPAAPAPVLSPSAATALNAAVMAKKPVPVNTLINADNVKEFFAVNEVKAAPDGAVTNLDDLKGKFIVKPLAEGQWVFKSATDAKARDLPTEAPPVEGPPAERARFPRFEQVIQEGGRTRTIIWLEVAPEKWKRFDSEKDVDEYRPEPEAPKATEPSGEATKAAPGVTE
jgi:hypothetical protein